MAQRPCTSCGELRTVSTASAERITCQRCRRARTNLPAGADRQRELWRQYARTHRAKQTNEPRPPVLTKNCEVCSSPTRGRFCDRHRHHWKGHRRRARRYGVQYEYINPRTIYTRDRWHCGLCGEPVDPALSYPHPRSVSLDHVLPMSRGGDHTPANVQCAHLDCNMVKNADGGGEQLVIVG